jgi:ABC-type branched-subunit amino acid transport system permease subunit
MSGCFAGMAGVLLAPIYQSVDSNTFTILVVTASAAAVFGRLSSLPMTLAGAVVIGIAQQLLASKLDLNSVLARGLRPSLPFIVLFLLLLFWPGLRRSRTATDPLSGVDPPPPALAVTLQDPRLARVNKIAFPVFVTLVLLVATFVVSLYWVRLLTEGIVLTIVFLSMTVLTGLAGQISLAQASFVGIGAFTAGQLASRWDVPILGGMLVAAALCAVIGALLALPCLRLGGLYLALGTLAFALCIEQTLFTETWFTGGQFGVDVPRPEVGPIDFANERAFFLLCFGIFAVCGFLVILVRRGTTGQYLTALRGSEVAATAIGINPVRAKVIAFSLSAGIAGVGGVLTASRVGTARPEDFPALIGVVWLLLLVSLGARTVDGAVNAGMGFVFFPVVLEQFGMDQTLALTVQYAAFGLSAISFAKHPEGIVEHQKRKSIEKMNARIAKRWGPPKAAPDRELEPPAPVDVTPVVTGS